MKKKNDAKLYPIIEGYHDRIRKFIAVTVKDEWVADDLTQETFLRAHRNLEKLEEPDKISAWLFRTAYNLCIDHFRAASRRSFEPLEAVEHRRPAVESSPRKALECSQMSLCVQDKAMLLPESYRSIVWLCDVSGFTLKETAEILDISIENAKVRLHRARKKLRAILKENCDFERDERDIFVCVPKEDE